MYVWVRLDCVWRHIKHYRRQLRLIAGAARFDWRRLQNNSRVSTSKHALISFKWTLGRGSLACTYENSNNSNLCSYCFASREEKRMYDNAVQTWHYVRMTQIHQIRHRLHNNPCILTHIYLFGWLRSYDVTYDLTSSNWAIELCPIDAVAGGRAPVSLW